MGVFAGLLGVSLIGVAGFAGVMSGEVEGMLGDFVNGCAAIVAVLAKCGRNHKLPDRQEHQKRDDEKSGEAE
jgi:hypothetical protein